MSRIRLAQGETDVEQARVLFREYASSLGFGLEFQDFETELSSLPGAYGAPRGCILIAEEGGEVAGCVALRPLDADTCEMKRLYVRPDYRGRPLGRELAEEVIARARGMGYESMRLDTVASMTVANALYEALGFVQTEPYRHNPLEDARYYELRLGRGART